MEKESPFGLRLYFRMLRDLATCSSSDWVGADLLNPRVRRDVEVDVTMFSLAGRYMLVNNGRCAVKGAGCRLMGSFCFAFVVVSFCVFFVVAVAKGI